MNWYYARQGQQQGPVEEKSFFALARDGKLRRDDLVWNATFGDQWVKASTVPGLFGAEEPAISGDSPGRALPPALHVHYVSLAPNRDLMAEGRAALAGSWGLAVSGVLVYAVIQSIIGLLNIIPFLGSVLGLVVAGPLTLGWCRFFITLARRQPAAVGMLFDGFKRFGTAVLATLLMGLLIFAWMLPGVAIMIATLVMGIGKTMGSGWRPSTVTVLWLAPLMVVAWIPAVIAQFRYSMTYFIINDRRDIGAWAAVQHSARMMKGNKAKFFFLQCRFIGWALLCLPTLGIGFLWLLPYLMTTMGRFYDELGDDPNPGRQ